jgi:hypothetical protein
MADGILNTWILMPIIMITGASVAYGMTNTVTGAGLAWLRGVGQSGFHIGIPNPTNNRR